MLALLIGTNKLVMQGMASSSRSQIRDELEEEIQNDIASIQAVDTMLNIEPHLGKACSTNKSSSAYLAEQIQAEIPASTNTPWQRELSSEDPFILRITYSISFPDQPGESELRIVEVNPSFAVLCHLKP